MQPHSGARSLNQADPAGPATWGRFGLRLRLLIAGFLCVSAATPPQPAHAFSLFGRCLFNCDEPQIDPDIIDPHTYDLEFVFEGEERSSIRNASALWQNRDGAVGGDAGVLSRAKGDYRRILAALYNEGRYKGAVSITVNGAQAAFIPVGTDLPLNSNIVVTVDPGPVYTFDRAEVRNAPPPGGFGDEVDDPADEGFASGAPALAGKVRQAGRLTVEAWRQQGHPKASVVDRDATAKHPSEELDVVVTVDPGPRAAYGPTLVEGTERMDPEFVRYMADLEPGAEFDPDDLERARERFDRLGVFSVRRIVEGDVDNGLMPISVIVKERKLRRIGLGVTASTLDGFGAEGFWLHRNLFGRAERLRLEAKAGGLGATGNDEFDPAFFDYGLGATFTKPGIFTPDTDLVLNAYARREVNDTFIETSAGASALINHYVTQNITLRYGIVGQYGEFEDVLGRRTYATLSVPFEGTWDLRDDKLDPTEGFYFEAGIRPFAEFERSNFGVRTQAEVRAYEDFGTDGRSIIAARIKVGSLFGASILDVPPDTLFLTGGGGSVRGYSFKSIGVPVETFGVQPRLGPNGEILDTLGGRSLAETSVELRQKFTDTIGAVAFVDAGIVSADSLSAFDEDIKIGVGLGLRYYTGLGPIRLDVAVPLDPGRNDSSFAIYAGIGHAF